MANTVLVIGAGPYQLPVIHKARQMGFDLAVVDADPQAVGLSWADHPFVEDIRDLPACLAIARRLSVCGVLALASEVALPTVAGVAAALGLVGPTPQAVHNVTNKFAMRQAFHRAQVPSAESRRAITLEEARQHALQIGWPVVVKPVDNAGSRGVSLVERDADFPVALQRAMDASRSGAVLVESFMEGPEISVEGFAYGGRFHLLCLSEKRRTPPPNLLDRTVLFPGSMPLEVRARIVAVAVQAVAAVELDAAPVHMEMILTADGPRMVEMAGRGAGFHVFAKILPWVTGVDTLQQLLLLSTGVVPDFRVSAQRGAVIHFPEALPGRVTAVSGLEAVRAMAGVMDAEVYVKPGDVVQPLTSGADRVGHLIVTGADQPDAERILAQALATLVITTQGDHT